MCRVSFHSSSSPGSSRRLALQGGAVISLGERALTRLLASVEEAATIPDFTPEGNKSNLRTTTTAALNKQVVKLASLSLSVSRSHGDYQVNPIPSSTLGAT